MHYTNPYRFGLLCISLLGILLFVSAIFRTNLVAAEAPALSHAGTSPRHSGRMSAPAERSLERPQDCVGQWAIVQSPNVPYASALLGVDSVSPTNVWAVGLTWAPSSGIQRTLTEHWNGTSWSVVTSANASASDNALRSVSAISDHDIWAVGSYSMVSGSISRSLIEHWNGSVWSVVTAPDPPGPGGSDLMAVKAFPDNNVWAVGTYDDANGRKQTFALHWGGNAWTTVPSPNVGSASNWLLGVDGTADDNVWAAGYLDPGDGSPFQTLTLHWDGSSWIVIPSPNVGRAPNYLTGVAAVTQNDVWAVGYTGSYPGPFETLIMRWDGVHWNVVASPNSPNGMPLWSVNAVSSTDVWAVGGYFLNGSTSLIEHWDGSAWSILQSSDPPDTTQSELSGVVAVSATDVWAVGQFADSTIALQTLTKHYTSVCSTGTPTPTSTSISNPTTTPTPLSTTVTTPTETQTGTSTPSAASPTATSTNSPTSVASPTAHLTATVSATATVTPTGTPPTATPSATPCPMNFSDVHTTDYFYVPVRYLFCEGAISGYADNTFRPYNNTTRGQLSKIVVLAERWSIDTTGGPHFVDVAVGSAFYGYVETAYNRHVISGYADNTFRPGANVTRAQLSKIVVNSEGWTIDTAGGPHFVDVPPTDAFYGFIETAYNHGIISGYGDNTFRPGANATRGQISKIVYGAVTQP